MNKFALITICFSLALLGSSCNQPEEFTFHNSTNDSTETSMENLPKSDKVGQTITVTPPANLLEERTETNSDSKEGPRAVITTTFGDITIQLFEEATPKTVENFVTLAEQDFYDGTIFHRVIKDFMIQGGDPLTREQRDTRGVHGRGGPDYRFADEINLHKNTRGMISMANAGPNTNGSQFFIITAPATPHLDGIHAVFGEVIEGMDIVDKIENTDTDPTDHPVNDIEIIDIVIQK